MGLIILFGAGISNADVQQNKQTMCSVATDEPPAVLIEMDKKVTMGINAIVTVAEKGMQLQKEILLTIQEEAEALASEPVQEEAEALASEPVQEEAEALASESAKEEAEAPVSEPVQMEAEVLAATQSEVATVLAEELVVIEEEETATTATPGDDVEKENAEDVNVQETMTASELLQCINAERSAAGLAPLAWSDELAMAAGVRSVEAVSRFEHVRPDGTDFFTVSELAMAENLARGDLQTTAQEIVDKWMESTGGHRQNILDSRLYTVGIVIYERDGQLTICALFG